MKTTLLRQVRRERRITVEEIAPYLGFTVEEYRRLEEGRRRPSAYHTFVLLLAFGFDWKSLQLPVELARHGRKRLQLLEKCLEIRKRYKPGMFRHLQYRHPLVDASDRFTIGTTWWSYPPPWQESIYDVPPKDPRRWRYATGRIDRPHLRPSRRRWCRGRPVNQLLERVR